MITIQQKIQISFLFMLVVFQGCGGLCSGNTQETAYFDPSTNLSIRIEHSDEYSDDEGCRMVLSNVSYEMPNGEIFSDQFGLISLENKLKVARLYESEMGVTLQRPEITLFGFSDYAQLIIVDKSVPNPGDPNNPNDFVYWTKNIPKK